MGPKCWVAWAGLALSHATPCSQEAPSHKEGKAGWAVTQDCISNFWISAIDLSGRVEREFKKWLLQQMHRPKQKFKFQKTLFFCSALMFCKFSHSYKSAYVLTLTRGLSLCARTRNICFHTLMSWWIEYTFFYTCIHLAFLLPQLPALEQCYPPPAYLDIEWG